MSTRFATKDALKDALRKQKIVAGNSDLAEAIAQTGEAIDVPAKTTLIHQGGEDDDVYLVVSGSFHIVVNGKTIARRIATDHIGEMAAFLPLQRRAASVVAHEDAVVVRLSNEQIADLGNRFAQIWRFFALELAHRLEQRNILATAPSDQDIRILILASSPKSAIAHAIRNACEADRFNVVLWTDGAFGASGYAVDKLEESLDQSDVAIALVDPHEKTVSRDSVIFELGFFMGRLGRHRTFLVEPRAEEMKLPSELAGIGTITYNASHDPAQAAAHACNKLRKAIHELGPNR
ncbi:MAG TPA: TIR domain-containing protein [Bryobacteraceae bacterium]|jgi:predicted nucleotide-binding protein|nr:TIR domain-containing protein [Bryobacteraceae bacterium]